MWSSEDGSTRFRCNAVGATIRPIFVGSRAGTAGIVAGASHTTAAGAFGAAGTRRLFVSLEADASTGPTKIIRVTDIPGEPEQRIAYLKERLQESKLHAALAIRLDQELKTQQERLLEVLRERTASKGRIGAVGGESAASVRNDSGKLSRNDQSQAAGRGGRGSSAIDQGSSSSSSSSFAAVSLSETLWVQVVSAVGLPAGDGDTAGDEFSDPFCRVELSHGLNPRPLYTRRVPSTLDPVWGESFTFELGHALYEERSTMRRKFGSIDPRATELRTRMESELHGGPVKLHVTLYDYDASSSNDILGCVQVPLWQLPKDSLIDGWYPLAELSDSSLKARGSVRLRILRTADVAAASAEHARRVLRRARVETECLCRRLSERLALEEANRVQIPATVVAKLGASLGMALGQL